jgi:hypothetical protein
MADELVPPVADVVPPAAPEAAAATPAVEAPKAAAEAPKKFVPLVDMLELEGSSQIDPTTVFNKDPNFYYCWISATPQRLEYNKAVYGYELVGLKDKESVFSPPNALGERRLGDVVLAKMPMERYERIMKRQRARTLDGMAAANEAWKAAVEGAGMQVVGEVKVEKKVGM